MKDLQEQMRAIARKLLVNQEVSLVLGWEKGKLWYKPSPVFIRKSADVEKLIFDQFCHNNLAKYLLHLTEEDRIAIFVKGCDSRAILGLIQDNCLKRERIYLIGIPCPGLLDSEAARGKIAGTAIPTARKCEACQYPSPLVYDILLGENSDQKANLVLDRNLELVTQLESLSLDERYQFWSEQFSKCIRCYACRNICPACNCRECILEQTTPPWLGKANNLCENQFMQLTRAMHVAGRCIECGECERACPMNIPLMAINKKITQDLAELFGEKGNYQLTDPLGGGLK